jgi:hypothetical protein
MLNVCLTVGRRDLTKAGWTFGVFPLHKKAGACFFKQAPV